MLLIGSALGGRSNLTEMLGTLGYANAPRAIALFTFIPFICWIFDVAAFVLAVIAGLIAIREALEVDTGKALITAVLGLLAYIVVRIIIEIALFPFRLIF